MKSDMRLLESILDLFFPPKCIFCHKVMDGDDICPKCAEKLPYTKGDGMFQTVPGVKECIAPLYYEDEVRLAILRFKFWGKALYAHRFGLIIAYCLENNLDCGDINVISWVPLSRKRLRKRGYNQARLLAEHISRKMDIPCAPTLVKTVDNPAQSGTKSRDDRLKNVKGVYAISENADVKGKSILLVDDVVTTGATLSECARTLKNAGARYVYCAAIARRRD